MRLGNSVFRWQTVVAVLIGLVISLFLFVVAENLDPNTTQPTWIIPLLENIGATIMVAATIGLIFDLFTRSEMMHLIDETKDTISQQIGTLRSLEELGLIDVHPNTYDYPWKDLLLSSEDLTIVLNDGRSWQGRHSDYLRTRMMIPERKTLFIFQHPDSKMNEEVLSPKLGQSFDYLREKVNETIKELVAYPRHETHELQILGHHFFNPYSLFVSEEFAMMCPYYISPNRSVVPTFVFEKRGQASQYVRFYDDVQQLIKLSTPLEPRENP